MRNSHTLVAALLLTAALGCSSRDTFPTEATPEFATSCSTPKPRIAASPTALTQPSGARDTTKFVVKNNCTTRLTGWTLTSSRTGAVTGVSAPSRTKLPPLDPGKFVNVYVSYRVGSSGTGTVVLLATSASGLTSFGYQTVTVSSF
jgi:hypothetical protein